MKNEKGFSLIELIMVIAIMGVVMGIAGLSFSMVGSTKAKSASRNIYNVIGSAQNLGMSKDNCYFAIMCESNGKKKIAVIYGGKTGTDYSIVSEQSIPDVVRITYTVSDGAATTVTYNLADHDNGSTDNQGVIVKINRSTGAFEKTYIYNGDITDSITNNAAPNITDITIKQNNGEYVIGLSNVTGKYYYK